MAHTSAPWTPWYEFDEDGHISEAGVDSGPNREVNVCVTTCENIEVEDIKLFNGIVKADTNLIAAAPDLLAAIESILDIAEEGLRNAESDAKAGVEGAQEAYEKGRLAIEAAEAAFYKATQ